MELRVLKCDVKGCTARAVETHANQGFPGWGHVAGLVNAENGIGIAHLCPDCMAKIKRLLNGDEI